MPECLNIQLLMGCKSRDELDVFYAKEPLHEPGPVDVSLAAFDAENALHSGVGAQAEGMAALQAAQHQDGPDIRKTPEELVQSSVMRCIKVAAILFAIDDEGRHPWASPGEFALEICVNSFQRCNCFSTDRPERRGSWITIVPRDNELGFPFRIAVEHAADRQGRQTRIISHCRSRDDINGALHFVIPVPDCQTYRAVGVDEDLPAWAPTLSFCRVARSGLASGRELV